MPEPELYRNRQPRWRKLKRQALKARGITPAARQFIWSVETTAIPIPEWARKNQVKGLAEQGDRVWLWTYDARKLIADDQMAGGSPIASEVEYRICEVCARPLLGVEAQARRAQVESGFGARHLACGPDCQEASKDGRWKKLRA